MQSIGRLAGPLLALALLAHCGGIGDKPTPGFTLLLSAPSGSLGAGETFTVTATLDATNGFVGSTSLSARGLPDGVTAAFSPASFELAGNAGSTLTLAASADAASATATVVVEATAGAASRQATFELTVTRTTSAGGFTVTVEPPEVGLGPGSSTTAGLTVTSQGGFVGTVDLSASGLPPGASATFDPPSVVVAADAPASATLTVTTTADAAATGMPVAVSVAASLGSQTQAALLAVSIFDAADPDVQRRATLTAVEKQIVALEAQGLSRLDLVHAVADFMATRPEYVATAIDEDTLSATGEFADGRLHIVALNSDPTLTAAVPPASPARALTAASSGSELPASSFARLVTSFDKRIPDAQRALDNARSDLVGRGWMARAGAPGDARVATLRSVAGDGLFAFTTHGGQGKTRSGATIYGLASSTVVNPAIDKFLESVTDLNLRRLVYMTVWNGGFESFLGIDFPAAESHYGITSAFTDTYWRFDPNAIVFLNACSSASQPDLVTSLTGLGINVFLGWTTETRLDIADRALRFLADRMVGANERFVETPFQRPFAYPGVVADLAAKGYIPDPSTGSTLVAIPGTSATLPAALAPSIRTMVVDEHMATLKLLGDFGTISGKVKVSGTDCPVMSWSVDTIVCSLPPMGAGSSGDVQVESHGVKSNLRQLSEWRLTLHYRWTPIFNVSGMVIDGEAHLRFRGDVTGFRNKPAEDLNYLLRGMVLTPESDIVLVGSGSGSSGGCTVTMSGSATYTTQPGGLQLVAALKVDPKTKRGALGLAFGNPGPPPFTVTTSGSQPECTGSSPFAPIFGLLGGSDMFPQTQEEGSLLFPLPAIQIAFNDDFTLPVLDFSDISVGLLRLNAVSTALNGAPRDDKDSGR